MNFYLINPDAEHRGILLIKFKGWSTQVTEYFGVTRSAVSQAVRNLNKDVTKVSSLELAGPGCEFRAERCGSAVIGDARAERAQNLEVFLSIRNLPTGSRLEEVQMNIPNQFQQIGIFLASNRANFGMQKIFL